MCITNTNIFQPRILPKPELTQTLSKTNLKKIESRARQSITYYSCQLQQLLREKLVQKKCPSAEGLGIKKSNPPFIREGGGSAPPTKFSKIVQRVHP